ncbi:MAG: large repetitive protein, partial [Actinomycetota bacterium]|nr:large repetitive protein [Actinomycetota bacterium]
TLDEPQVLQDAGSTYAPGTATHSVTMHRAASGALVFDAGSVQWSWGLDGTHDRGASTPDSAMQQATVNLFADMTAQPATPQPGIVAASASTDTGAPTAAIGSPGNGDAVIAGSPTTVTGTASDTGGGRVAGVEVSTNDGLTWHPANGHDSWSYTFTPQTAGSLTLRSRATDDSVNTGTSSAPVTIQVAPHSCPCSIWDNSATPASVGNNDGQPIDYGVKFRSDVDGTVSGFRFYKSPGDTGTHVGHLWDLGGNQLASATFSGESASGWQEVALAPPVAITAGTTYVVSIFSSAGVYSFTGGYFTSAGVDNPPLHALQTGVAGNNAVYHEGPSDAFPTDSFNASNYWADVIMSDGPDTTPPVITSRSPAANATGVSATHSVTATFNEPMNPSTISSSTFQLLDAGSALVPASVHYDASSRTATLTPNASLSPSVTYTAVVKSGVADASGNQMGADAQWSFKTAAPPPDDGPGGPILVIGSTANPFGRYYGEILRAEGLNEFRVTDISTVTAGVLANYDVVVLGQMALTAAQKTMFTNWVNAGGKFVAMRPDAQLSGLLGIASTGGNVSNAYMQIDTTKSPGQGITGATMQFHGTADDYALFGASKLATLYSDANTATNFPAVTLRAVGSSGGQAAAFTYDLARSVVYTRQGNPAWSGQERDGQAPIRSDDLFFGASTSDPQPDWVNLSKVAIPQADEQQRLFANLVLKMESAKKPLPRFWYLPRGNKAAVVMTGDDHGNGGTAGRFDQQVSASAPSCNVAKWECVRSTSYVYTGTPLTNQQATAYTQQGFEVGLHVSTDCVDWTPASLANAYNTQLADWLAKYTTVPGPVSNRTHCIPDSDYSTQPHVELANGMRLDTNYYYWPPSWIQDRPGLFTGSGFP